MNEVKAPNSQRVLEAIFAYEEIAKDMPQVEYDTIHNFTPGLYIREMRVPAGTMLTGMIHKTEHLSIFLEGSMIVADGVGGNKEIHAPLMEKGLPGIKRAGYTLTDVRWITVHATDETDIEILDETLTTNDYSEVAHLVDQRDFKLLADELGYTEEVLDKYRKIEFSADPVDGVIICASKRHGKGVFVTREFSAGEVIAPAIKDGVLMQYSRYCNHSVTPNAFMRPIDGVEEGDLITSANFELVALRDINDEEVTVNYRAHGGRLEVDK